MTVWFTRKGCRRFLAGKGHPGARKEFDIRHADYLIGIGFRYWGHIVYYRQGTVLRCSGPRVVYTEQIYLYCDASCQHTQFTLASLSKPYHAAVCGHYNCIGAVLGTILVDYMENNLFDRKQLPLPQQLHKFLGVRNKSNVEA